MGEESSFAQSCGQCPGKALPLFLCRCPWGARPLLFLLSWLLPGLSPSSSLPHTLLAQRPSESWGSTPAGQHVPLQRKTMSFFFFPMANKGFGDKIWGNGDSWRFPACYRSCLGTRVCARGPIPSPSPGQRQWRGGWSQMPVSNKAQLPP